jgi:hypothetical protein
MTDTFPNGPGAPGDSAPHPTVGDVTGTLADLERKLRELERELTSIGRRRELAGEGAAPQTSATAQAGGRLVDEAIESPTQLTPRAPAAPSPEPVEPARPGQPVEPAGPGQPVKFVRPLESARGQAREPLHRNEPSAEGEGRVDSPQREALEAQERPRPSEAQLASLAELRRFRDRLERFAKDLTAEYDALLSRVMAGLSAPSAAPSPPPEATLGVRPAEDRPAAAPAPTGEETLFEGRVELGVGPFYDIASLSAFERRLASVPHVSEASVRRFEASHAVVDLRLAAPVALVRELRQVADTDFNVREVAAGRLLLTFDDT